MSVIKLYKYSLFLPVIVPLVFAPAVFYLRSMTETMALIVLIIVYSGLVGIVPYLILTAILLKQMRGKSEGQIRRILSFSPFIMILIFCALAVISLFPALQFFSNEPARELIQQILILLIFCSLFTLLFGYFYIALIFGFVWIYKKTTSAGLD